MDKHVVSASMFFPRGGSAHVLRALATNLPRHGWDVTVLSGSRHDQGGHGDARRFYQGLDVREVDYTPALHSPDPQRPPRSVAPMHPSFEDRPDAPDPVFAKLDDAAYERHVATWAAALDQAPYADVLHLHHLTPINEAAARTRPDTPVVAHLHGTELLMLERIAEGAPASGAHAVAWAERMRRWARRAERVVLLDETQRRRARDLLGVEPDRCVVVPNGFDPTRFRPAERAPDREAVWRRVLVEEPRGWRPGEPQGSVAYEAPPRPGQPVVLYVGRFTEVKRVGLLVEAHARAETGAALVLVGGHPGEWEGEHPYDAIERTGAGDVFLAGWHDHDELPALLQAADVLVLPSVREQFGQVLVEAMACAIPPIAVDRYGPARIVDDGRTGWLVEPDDAEDLARALSEAVADEAERRRRGEEARREACALYSWPAIAGDLADVLESAAAPDLVAH